MRWLNVRSTRLGVLVAAVLLGTGMTSPAPAAERGPARVAGYTEASPMMLERIAGANRYATAAQVATAWPSDVETAFVVSGTDYPDALTAAARAGALDQPVLLTRTTSIPVETRQALDRLQPTTIVLVGGAAAVGQDVQVGLARYATSGKVQRLSGPDRYATAAKVSSQYSAEGGPVFLASGEDFPDALSAAALAGHQRAPLLLTRAGRLPPSTVAALRHLSADEVIVVGGPAAISADVARRAATLTTSGSSRRLAGTDRYQTAATVAREFSMRFAPAYVASGQTFPDALVGAALAATRGVPLLLTPQDEVSPSTQAALRRLRPTGLYGLGGEASVRQSTLATMADEAVPTQIGPPVLGATFHGFWNYANDDERSNALRLLRNAGAGWVRIDMGWATIEDERGTYSEWALRRYDTAIEQAHASGLNVLLVLQRTPAWANGSDDYTLAPRDPEDFASFAADMTRRYVGEVQAVETWNEPNGSSFFTARTPGREAEEHAGMVREAYAAIKTEGPQGSLEVSVLAGGTSYVDTTWWRRLYELNIKGVTDAVAVNPYMSPADLPPTAPDTGQIYRFNHLAELALIKQEFGDADKPIWLTEFGWSSHANEPDTMPWARGVSEQRQADYFADSIALLRASYPQVTHAFWYNTRTRGTDDPHQANFGLLRRDLSPKPVLDAFTNLMGS